MSIGSALFVAARVWIYSFAINLVVLAIVGPETFSQYRYAIMGSTAITGILLYNYLVEKEVDNGKS